MLSHKIHAKELHAKPDHPRDYRQVKNLNYSVIGTLEACEDWYKVKSKNELLFKVAEKEDLKPGKLIYINISLN